MTAACPVCAEPLAARAERCFRCETPLAAWWRFDEALGAMGGTPPAAASAGSGSPVAAAAPSSEGDGMWLGFVILLGGGALVGALVTGAWMSRNERPVAPPAGPAPSRVAAVPPVPLAAPITAAAAGTVSPPPGALPRSAPALRYRVQRGDSLWRIAAALTGDGRRWRELWPGRASEKVRAGEWLDVPPQASP